MRAKTNNTMKTSSAKLIFIVFRMAGSVLIENDRLTILISLSGNAFLVGRLTSASYLMTTLQPYKTSFCT